MAKTADKYFITAPWEIIEEDYNPAYGRVSESIFSLGNEYMGIRGFFEEEYSGDSLHGSYFNGIYERTKIQPQGYVGIIDHTEFMVNSVNWLYTRLILNEEVLDLHTSKFHNFKRVLDLKAGLLTRSFEWITKEGYELYIKFERFLSMNNATMAGQKITIVALNFNGKLTLVSGLDFTEPHYTAGENFWTCSELKEGHEYLSILGTTKNTKQKVQAFCKFAINNNCKRQVIKEENKISMEFELMLEKDRPVEFHKIVKNIVSKDESDDLYDSLHQKVNQVIEDSKDWDYESLFLDTKKWWKHTWDYSDIQIEGDELNQQGIRFCIFQMHQTYHGTKVGTNIGAKGLTGEAYSGNAFWDTETYCLPFYIFNNVKAAKNLLMYRYVTLDEAKERARALDCKGAFYPIATISGKECCSLWQHASLQLQASTAVAYGVWIYEKITKDIEFVYNYGLPMLIEISRMLATRGDYSADGTRYGFYGVMGPDEFQMMVNHNCYTNYMGRMTVQYTLETLHKLKEENQEKYRKLIEEYQLEKTEYREWENIVNLMYIPYEEETKLYEQHEGYFKLPHVEVDQIPVEDFPLYHHWTYDRIYRNDMVKQPDVLMFMLLFNSSFTQEQLRVNYEFYEPRCIHESSLSPSVHSILANQLHKHKEAFDFFGFATRMDLDNYNRNTNEGLHTTSIAAAWMNIVYGFGGLRTDGEKLALSPSIPKEWEGYSFRICYQEDAILVTVKKETVEIRTLEGKHIEILLYGGKAIITREKLSIPIPIDWRG